MINEIKIKRQDDIMTYLAIREEYRSTIFAAVGLMVIGLITMIFSLEKVSHAICIIAVCFLTPPSTSMAFH